MFKSLPLEPVNVNEIFSGKRDFAEVLSILRWEIILDYLGGPNVIPWVLISERAGGWWWGMGGVSESES